MSGAGKRDGAPSRPSGKPAAKDHEDHILQLAAEELSVTKKTIETGRVRVSTQTREREVLVNENLAHERVEIETIPIGRQIEAAPEIRQDGDTTIIPVVEEVVTVERRLVLKEEIRIKRVRTVERHREKVILRHQEAVVTRQPADTGEAGAPPAAGFGQSKTEQE